MPMINNGVTKKIIYNNDVSVLLNSCVSNEAYHQHTMAYRINIVCGNSSVYRSKPTPAGYTHDWELYIKGQNNASIHNYIDKKPKRHSDSSRDKNKEKSKDPSKSSTDEKRKDRSDRKKDKKKPKDEREREKKDKHRDRERENERSKEASKPIDKKPEKETLVEPKIAKDQIKSPKPDKPIAQTPAPPVTAPPMVPAPVVSNDSIEKIKEHKHTKSDKDKHRKEEKDKSRDSNEKERSRDFSVEKEKSKKHKKRDKKDRKDDSSRDKERKERKEKYREKSHKSAEPAPPLSQVAGFPDRLSSESAGSAEEETIVDKALPTTPSKPDIVLRSPSPIQDGQTRMSPPTPRDPMNYEQQRRRTKDKSERKRERTEASYERKQDRKRARHESKEPSTMVSHPVCSQRRPRPRLQILSLMSKNACKKSPSSSSSSTKYLQMWAMTWPAPTTYLTFSFFWKRLRAHNIQIAAKQFNSVHVESFKSKRDELLKRSSRVIRGQSARCKVRKCPRQDCWTPLQCGRTEDLLPSKIDILWIRRPIIMSG
ncbi:unnamed protein product, partial [Trichogramma brassicae]